MYTLVLIICTAAVVLAPLALEGWLLFLEAREQRLRLYPFHRNARSQGALTAPQLP